MKLRFTAVLLAIVSVVGLSACVGPSPVLPRPIDPCVPGHDTVIIAGDSVTAQWSQSAAFPPGTRVLNLSRGSAAYSGEETQDVATTFSIRQRLEAQLDACNWDVGLVVLSGGVNDLAAGQTPDAMESGAAAISASLAARDINTVWVPILPWAVDDNNFTDVRFEHRLEFNEWLSTPGRVNGPVLQCNSVLRDPNSAEELLAPGYRRYVGFTLDVFHINDAAKWAFGGCVTDQIDQGDLF
jgi:hypothetical protein